MGWLTFRLGNGRWGTVDGDLPDSPPQVTVANVVTTTPAALTQYNFTRILNEQFYDGEEVRHDLPTTFKNSFEYVGVAPSGSGTGELVWSIVRKSFDVSGNETRFQIRLNLSWDERANGWS